MKSLLTKAIIVSTLIMVIAAGWSCCMFSKKMSNEEFMTISFDFAMAMAPYAMQKDKYTEAEYNKIGESKLEEICKRYGFSVWDYKCKANEMGTNSGK